MPYLSLGLRCVLGWIFLTSAVDKLQKRDRFRADLVRYRGMHANLIRPVSVLVPLVELLLGGSLLFGMYWRLAALASALLLGMFTIALAGRVLGGAQQPCGCGGLMPSESTSHTHLVANAALIVIALTLTTLTDSQMAVTPPWPLPFLANPGGALSVHAILTAILSLTLLLWVSVARSIFVVWQLRRDHDAAAFGEKR